jgi:hypothetical protein
MLHVRTNRISGVNLDDLSSHCGEAWCITTVGQIWLMLIDRLETIHRCGFVLRYIKGANMCMGGGGEDLATLFVVGFAGCKKYLDDGNRHVLCDRNISASGNAAFRSVCSDKDFMPSRRDDLESAAYAMLAFVDEGKLPRLKRNPDIDRKGSIDSSKLSRGYKPFHLTLVSVIFAFLKRHFIPYSMITNILPLDLSMVEYVKKLKFEECPDYDRLWSYIVELGFCRQSPSRFEFQRGRTAAMMKSLVAGRMKSQDSTITHPSQFFEGMISRSEPLELSSGPMEAAISTTAFLRAN